MVESCAFPYAHMQGMVLGAQELFCRFETLPFTGNLWVSQTWREGWMDIQNSFTLNPLSAQRSWTLEMVNA